MHEKLLRFKLESRRNRLSQVRFYGNRVDRRVFVRPSAQNRQNSTSSEFACHSLRGSLVLAFLMSFRQACMNSAGVLAWHPGVESPGGQSMATRSMQKVPAELARAAARWAQWRRTPELGARIPRSLWKLTIELATRYGVSKTAIALRVDY